MPKSLLPIGPRSLTDKTETSLLRRQVELLAACGVEQIVVVVGYQRQLMIDALDEWAPDVQVVVNATPDMQTSGSLHSFQFAARAGLGILDGSKQTLLMDADIVYQRAALRGDPRGAWRRARSRRRYPARGARYRSPDDRRRDPGRGTAHRPPHAAPLPPRHAGSRVRDPLGYQRQWEDVAGRGIRPSGARRAPPRACRPKLEHQRGPTRVSESDRRPWDGKTSCGPPILMMQAS